MSATPPRALVADVGGTNTRVALAEGARLLPGSARHYRNADFAALEPVLKRFLAETGTTPPDAACVAMAGPVRSGRGVLTNLDWTLDTAGLAEATGARTVALLNDLQAQGHALGHLPEAALHVVVPGPAPAASATRLVVGLGTGFNAVAVHETAAGRVVPPSEAGHVALPVRNAEDLALAQVLAGQRGFASVEDALSGRGLAAIHAFLCARDGVEDAVPSHEVMARLGGTDAAAARARAALGRFVRLAGEVCGGLALTALPFGGVFLIGGMARAMAPHAVSLGFSEAFRDKGRFSEFMTQFRVTLVTDDDAALVGSAAHLQGLIAGRGL